MNPTTTRSSYPMRFQNRVVNPIVRTLLRSRLRPLLSGAVALITFTGRRSGRPYTTPVMYARAGDDVYVLVGAADQKTWWRNLAAPAPVRLQIAGRDHTGTGEILTGDQAAAGRSVYLNRFPRAARTAGPQAPVIRIRLDD